MMLRFSIRGEASPPLFMAAAKLWVVAVRDTKGRGGIEEEENNNGQDNGGLQQSIVH